MRNSILNLSWSVSVCLAILGIPTGFCFADAGDRDPTFGTGGLVTTDFLGPANDSANSIAIQADGKLVVVGSTLSAGPDFALARYNSDGTLDATFGAGGLVVTDFAGSNDQAFSVAIQADGKIVAAGWALVSGTGFDFALARYNSDGTLDATFGTGGLMTTDFAGSNDDRAFSVAIQADGKIVAAGWASVSGTGFNFALARYNGDGTLDVTFGNGGLPKRVFLEDTYP